MEKRQLFPRQAEMKNKINLFNLLITSSFKIMKGSFLVLESIKARWKCRVLTMFS